jgi:Dolichyl-phosphate-mannose-protein mannosyltransferase
MAWIHLLWVLLIGSFIALISANLQYNTAFVDEALYATIGEEYLLGSTWEKGLSWMGGSYIYPILSALLNRHWGLEGIRYFSMLCIVATGLLVGHLTTRLAKSRLIGLVSATIFLFSSITLNLAILGTYDSPSLLLLTVAFTLAWHAKQNPLTFASWSLTVLSALFFSAAVLIKYVAILWSPLFGLLFILTIPRYFGKITIWGIILIACIAPYLWLNSTDLLAYFSGQYSIEPATRFKITKQIISTLYLYGTGIIFTFIFVIPRLSWPRRYLLLVFFIGGCIPLIYHLGASNIRSLCKHLVYASVFFAPLAGFGFVKTTSWMLISRQRSPRLVNVTQLTVAVMVICVISSLWVALSDHWRFQRSWPNQTQTIAYLDEHLQPDDRIFAEASVVLKFHLFRGLLEPQMWASTWYLQYQGQYGTPAMKSAIQDKTYRFVILNGYFTPAVNQQLLPELTANYEPIFSQDYKLSGTTSTITTIWARKTDATTGFIK